MNRLGLGGGLLSALLLSACVTINIYFPAAQAEQAAERIVEDILGKEQARPPKAPGDKGAALRRHEEASVAGIILDFLVPAAAAATPDFNVDTPRIRKLQAAMKQRNAHLRPYYASGAIGFTRAARIAVRDAGAIPLKERNRVKKLVAAENRDRDALYREIAAANGHPEWEKQIRDTFARTWVEKADRGWWYQDAGGAWRRK